MNEFLVGIMAADQLLGRTLIRSQLLVRITVASQLLEKTMATMRSLDLMLVIVIVNYFNTKETTRLPKMSTVKRLEVDNSKVVGGGGSSSKLSYYWI